jgi:hypothetical protein
MKLRFALLLLAVAAAMNVIVIAVLRSKGMPIPGLKPDTVVRPRPATSDDAPFLPDVPPAERIEITLPPPPLLATWPPPAPPVAPVEWLRGDAWTKRYREYLDALPAPPAPDDRPAFGVELLHVFDGSEAQRLGMTTGDLIVSLDGRPVLGMWAFSAAWMHRAATLEVWSPGRGRRTVQVGAGRLGVWFNNRWQPEAEYLHSSDRNAAWDDYLRVASAAWNDDEALAETALNHAARAGYRGWLLPALMMRICADNGRLEEAVAWGWGLQETAPDDQRGVVLRVLYRALLAGGMPERAEELDQTHPEHALHPEDWDPEALMTRAAALGEADRQGPSPCHEAARSKAAPAKLEGLDVNADYVVKCLSEGRFECALTPGHGGAITHTGPPLRDLHVAVDCDIRATTPLDPKYAPLSRFRLTDIGDRGLETLASVELMPAAGERKVIDDYPMHVLACGYPIMPVYGWNVFRPGRNRLELGLRGPWCEVRVNGRRVFLGMVPDRPGRQVVWREEHYGVTLAVRRLEIRPLAREALSAAAPPASPARPPPDNSVKTPPAPSDPAGAWLHGALVNGYLAHGRRSAAWDTAAVEGLSKSLRAWARWNDLADGWEALSACARAMEAGCDDPLVVATRARLQRSVLAARDYEVVRWRMQAAEEGRSSGYAPLLRAAVLVEAAGEVPISAPRSHRAWAEAALDEAQRLLPEALADPAAPESVVQPMLRDLLDRRLDEDGSPHPALDALCEIADKAQPGSAIAPTLKSHAYIQWAWKARGSGFANTVTPEGWRLFRERLAIAAEAGSEAWLRDPKASLAATDMLTVARGHEATRQNVSVWMERALEADPENAAACHDMLWTLRPRWFGSHEAMIEFGYMIYTRAVEKDLGAPLLLQLVKAHEDVADDLFQRNEDGTRGRWQQEDYWREPAVWADVQRVFKRVFRRHPDSVYYRSRYAYYACRCGQWKEAMEQFRKLGNGVATAAFRTPEEAYRMRREAQRETDEK